MNRRFPKCTVFLVLLFFSVVCGTLSKSDRKEKSKDFQGTEEKRKGKNNSLRQSKRFEDNAGSVTVAGILNHHHNLCVEKKKFNHPILAYITPWNNGGYDIAKWAARKFTHISPVWFQFKPEVKQKTCIIFGIHDMDMQWLADVHANNSKIKFMPRFIIDGSARESIERFLYDERWQTNCAQLVVNFIKKNKMHGAVIEVWLQVLSLVQKEVKEELIELISHWAELFHQAELGIIVPLPAPLSDKNKPSGVVMKAELARIINSVDFVNVMTYDYNSDHFVGVSPFEWIRRNLEYILSESSISSSKLLMGLNFYGYASQQTTIKAVIGKDFIKYVTSQSGTGEDFCIYPTLASLQMRRDLANHFNVGLGIWELGQGLNYFTCLF
uniref:Chitinase domain-containing protein 1 n=1 Tax=Wuchereria bancrofti TaxID=6293 RepID=A0A1I8EJ88_WUCBA